MAPDHDSRFILKILPAFVLVATAGAAPFFAAIVQSVQMPSHAFGLGNYAVLFRDPGVALSLGISAFRSVLCAVSCLGLAVPVALAMHGSSRYSRVAFPFLVAIWSIPLYIGIPLARFFLHGAAGDSVFFSLTGLRVNLMTDGAAAFLASVIVSVWFRLPFCVFVLLSSLSKSRDSIADAAKLDGAGPAALGFSIRFPAMRDAVTALFLLEFLSCFKDFTVPWLLCAGGPPLPFGISDYGIVGSVTTIELYLYDLYRGIKNEGILSAFSVMISMAVFIPAVLLFYARFKRKTPRCAKAPKPKKSLSGPNPPAAGGDLAFIAATRIVLFVLAALTLALVYCLLWMSFSGFQTAWIDSIIPEPFTAAPYAKAFLEENAGLAFMNTVMISSLSALLALGCAFPLASALSRRSKAALFTSILLLEAITAQGGLHSLIPLFRLMSFLGISGGWTPVIIVYAFHSLPECALVIALYLRDRPQSFRDAARLEGLAGFPYLARIELPLAFPSIAATGMLAFLQAWNGFLAPLVFIDSEAAYPISLKLNSFVGSLGAATPRWNLFAAVSAVNIAVLLLLFAAFRKPLGRSGLAESDD